MKYFVISIVVAVVFILGWGNLISPSLNDQSSSFSFKQGVFKNTDVGVMKTKISGGTLKDNLTLEQKYDKLLQTVKKLSERVNSSVGLEYDYTKLERQFSDIQTNQRFYPSLDGDPTFALRVIAALDVRFGKTPQKVLEQLQRKKKRLKNKWSNYVLRQNERTRYLVSRSYWTWFSFLLPHFKTYYCPPIRSEVDSCFEKAREFHLSRPFLASVRNHLGEMSMGRHLYRMNFKIKQVADDVKAFVRMAKMRQNEKYTSRAVDSGEVTVRGVGSDNHDSGSIAFKVTGSNTDDSAEATIKVTGSDNHDSGSIAFKVTGSNTDDSAEATIKVVGSDNHDSGCNLKDCSNQ